MVLGSHFFVTPSDSVAIIAANAQAAIPYFKAGLKVGTRMRVPEGWGPRFSSLALGWGSATCMSCRALAAVALAH